jgi:chromosome segregation ATPase
MALNEQNQKSIGVEIKYKEKLADWQDLKETHEKYVKNAKETMTKQNEQISNMMNEMDSLKERLKAGENKIKLNETQIGDKVALIEQLKAKNSDLMHKLEELVVKEKALADQLNEKNRLITNLNESIDALKSQNESFSSSNKTLNEKLTNLSHVVKHLIFYIIFFLAIFE